ncbi:phosphoglycerate mutase family protein [Synechococcus sp. PCC 7335]|uniref:histidine phosphatase family protein n=1 Tax=Synechococcus sp. (strain ATCC 29403 / PCC 7335) TaxID=91464 RepID=UPI00017EDC65|nr:histidine phosphatase family protein [Synechococcus sp. PCC 7335]EDX84527.1 phosphoglycerate mutase family protein [Synechococcus sp. PCC 7335]
MQPITRVILVRHGRSTFNDQGRYQGSSNQSELTQQGQETARLVGQYLKQLSVTTPIDLIYTSPLRRVQQTAHEIVKAMAPISSPPVVVSGELKEISLSVWEGLSYKYVKQQFPILYWQWQQRPAQFALPMESENSTKGEHSVAAETYFPVQQLYHEGRSFWTKILPRHMGSTLLVVSHSGTIHALLSTALGLPPDCHHSLQQSNCGISELVFFGTLTFGPPHSEISHSEILRSEIPQLSGRVQIHQLNQTTALSEPLPKLKVNKRGLRLLLVPSGQQDDAMGAQHFQRLAERLEDLPIDFCVSTDQEQHWLRSLIQQHPNMLRLEAQKADFLEDWQQHLRRTCWLDAPLVTGLVIAPTPSIQKLLRQVLTRGLESDSTPADFADTLPKNCLALCLGYLSVVHYPYGHRPVVQAINI